MRRRFAVLIFWLAAFAAAFARAEGASPPAVQLELVAKYPHDKTAFTQGLFFDHGYFYESTGQYGRSDLRKVEPESGKRTMHVTIPDRYFAEGLTIVGNRIFVLTWREGVCLVFDVASLQRENVFRYTGEGWGLTFDGSALVMSDGTETLRFLDPKNFRQVRRARVLDKTDASRGEVPVKNLNELEYIHGEVWANVWQTTRVVRINPKSGVVLGWLEFGDYVPDEHKGDTTNNVLNGIAFDPKTDRVYITGKNWDVMYVFQLKRR